MTVNSNEVREMARLVAILNGQTAPETFDDRHRHFPAAVTPSPVGGGDPGIAAMRTILETYHQTTDCFDGVTRSLLDESRSDPELRTAMMTEATEAGVRIGEWEICLKENGKRKLYDVARIGYGTVIAADLTLYEAAYGIARALAKDMPITCPLIRNILIAEGEYAAALHDAIHHRHTLTKQINESRRAVLEDRYDVAKHRAATARYRIESLVGPLEF